jgi:hypothetical protein
MCSELVVAYTEAFQNNVERTRDFSDTGPIL